MKFKRTKPKTKGRYTWRLPEAEKPGTYDQKVEVTPIKGGEMMITTEEGDQICTMRSARSGTWAKGWAPSDDANGAG